MEDGVDSDGDEEINLPDSFAVGEKRKWSDPDDDAVLSKKTLAGIYTFSTVKCCWGGSGDGRRATSHAVRTARPPSKTTELWNRDVNAAIWMGFKLVLLARGWTEERLPDCLRRRNGGDLPPQPDFYQQTAH